MRYTSGPGFDSRWRPNIFNSVLFKKASEREKILFFWVSIPTLFVVPKGFFNSASID